MRKAIVLTAGLVSCGLGVNASAQQADMTFFITSVGSGKGADLGGLAGADAHCQALAQAAGAGNMTWRAYLSTNGRGGANAINARDRIGNGPWQNAKLMRHLAWLGKLSCPVLRLDGTRPVLDLVREIAAALPK